MTKPYTHLTEAERYHIYEGSVRGLSCRAIAKTIHRSPSTVSREVIRNRGLRGYRPNQAHKSARHKQQTKPKAIKLNALVKTLIALNIQKDWSPDQVRGRLKNEGLPMVCSTTIYAFIRRDKAMGGTLYKHLRHRKPYKNRTGTAETRGQIIGRVSIDERPAIVAEKSRLGDWEADTVIGKNHQGVLVTLADRCSRKTLAAIVPSKHAAVVRDAIIRLLLYENQIVKTITFDNGKEFAFHQQIKEALGADTFFAHPYHSWERGLNENHNGLIRQYLPKSMPLNKVTCAQIKEIQDKLNNRPRKTLEYKTPNEVYDNMQLAA